MLQGFRVSYVRAGR